MRKQREVLEHQPDVALLRRHEPLGPGHLVIVDEHPAAGRLLDAGGDPQQRGLAAARWPQQAHHLGRRNVERKSVERMGSGKLPFDPLERQPRGDRRRSPSRRRTRGALCRIGASALDEVGETHEQALGRVRPASIGLDPNGFPSARCRIPCRSLGPALSQLLRTRVMFSPRTQPCHPGPCAGIHLSACSDVCGWLRSRQQVPG